MPDPYQPTCLSVIVTMFQRTPHPSILAYSLLLPTRKGRWPTPHPTPRGATYAPNQPASISKDPIVPQPISKCVRKTPFFPSQSASVSEDPILPQPISKCARRPYSSPANQQVSRFIARPLLALPGRNGSLLGEYFRLHSPVYFFSFLSFFFFLITQ